MRRTSIEIDQERLDRAQDILGTSSIKDTVNRALDEVVRADLRRRLAEHARHRPGRRDPRSQPSVAGLTLYLADTSAWHRATHSEVAAAWEARLTSDSLATCAQVRLEIRGVDRGPRLSLSVQRRFLALDGRMHI